MSCGACISFDSKLQDKTEVHTRRGSTILHPTYVDHRPKVKLTCTRPLLKKKGVGSHRERPIIQLKDRPDREMQPEK